MATIYDWRSLGKLSGTDGDDSMYGLWGDDVINGGSGNDYIKGGSGNDTIYGGTGNDYIKGGSGNDIIYAGEGTDEIRGGSGNDTIYGGSGNDTLRGGSGNDTIYFGSGNNVVKGGKGSDIAHFKLYEHLEQNTSNVYKGGSGTDTLVIHLDAQNPDDYTQALVNANILSSGDKATVLNTGVVSNLHSIWSNAGLETGFSLKIKNVEKIQFEVTNRAPEGVDDIYTVGEDSVLVQAPSLLANDEDPNQGENLSVTEVNGEASKVGTPIDLDSGAILQVNSNGLITYNPAGSFNHLTAAQTATEEFNYTLTDEHGATDTANVLITIHGSNDAATITGDTAATVTDDTSGTVSGVLVVADPDSGEAAFNPETATGNFGSLDIDSNGSWTYLLDSNNAMAQSLGTGDRVADAITVYSADGTPENITITILGEPTRIAYTSAVDGNYEIFVTDADGTGTPIQITDNLSLDMQPEWSPDGNQIAYTGGDFTNLQVFVASASGSGTPTQISDNGGSMPQWSPDGTKVAYHASTETHSHIFVANADGSGDPMQVSSNDYWATYYGLQWSPDGTQLAYISYADGDGEIIVVDADGTGSSVQVTNNVANESYPEWSPDGTQIAYISDMTGTSEVYITNVDGSNFEETGESYLQLTTDAYARTPVWSPDGTKIAYSSYVGGDAYDDGDDNAEIFVLNLDGSLNPDGTIGPYNLTNSAATDTQPQWAPDGTQILFTSNETGSSNLYVVDIDGSADPTPLNPTIPHGYQGQWAPESNAFYLDSGDINLSSTAVDLTNVERISLTNDLTPQTITLSATDVLNINDGNALTIDTEGTNSAVVTTDNWTSTGNQFIGDTTYHTFVSGDATLLVEDGIDVDGITV